MKSWHQFIDFETKQDYLKQTLTTIENQRQSGITIFPPAQEMFTAFDLTPFEEVKVVILGQDPYHGPGQAHGLAFSVKPGIKPPPSLANMYKELVMDIEGFAIPQHGYLKSWAQQGVLLLNTVLTVEQGQAHSHKHLGWEIFTDKVIEQLNSQADKIVFLLWGAHAQKKGKNINPEKHFILNAPHPSPLSAHRGFFGSKPFSKTNQLLTSIGKKTINWHLD
jgi:uracil-DNA glycosylase